MTTNQIILTAIAGLLIPPAIVLITRKKEKGVIVICPGCRTELKLGRFRNYKCPKCHEDVQFFSAKTKKLREGTQMVKCSDCNMENVNGLKFCIKCNSELPFIRTMIHDDEDRD